MEQICQDSSLFMEMNDFNLSHQEFFDLINSQKSKLLDTKPLVKFYSKNYHMSKLELKKLCYTMSHMGNKYEKEALILAKYYGVFDSEKENDSILFKTYNKLIKEERLDFTSVACESLYFTSTSSILYLDYAKISCKHDKLNMLRHFFDKANFGLDDIYHLLWTCAENLSSECFDFLNKGYNIDHFLIKFIKQNKYDQFVFLYGKGIECNDLLSLCIEHSNVKILSYLLEEGVRPSKYDLIDSFSKGIYLLNDFFHKKLIFNLSLKHNVKEYFSYIDEITPDEENLMVCCKNDNLEMFVKIIEYITPNSIHLLISLKHNSFNISNYLLDNGIKPNNECLKSTNNNQLIEKIVSKNPEIDCIEHFYHENEIVFDYILKIIDIITYNDLIGLISDSKFRIYHERIILCRSVICLKYNERITVRKFSKKYCPVLREFFERL